MKYLLDAGSLVELFLRLSGEGLLGVLKECAILDLTIYEYANALWKHI